MPGRGLRRAKPRPVLQGVESRPLRYRGGEPIKGRRRLPLSG